jgi:hypothetical protein
MEKARAAFGTGFDAGVGLERALRSFSRDRLLTREPPNRIGIPVCYTVRGNAPVSDDVNQAKLGIPYAHLGI